jgi:hypothetical protein
MQRLQGCCTLSCAWSFEAQQLQGIDRSSPFGREPSGQGGRSEQGCHGAAPYVDIPRFHIKKQLSTTRVNAPASAAGANRHADCDFAIAFGDCVGHRPIDSEQRQEQGNRGKGRENSGVG